MLWAMQNKSVSAKGALSTVGPYSRAEARTERKHALVTGGSRGIGRAIAEALADDGYALTLVSRVRETNTSVAEALRSGQGATVTGLAADLSTRDGSRSIIEHLVRESDPLDVVVLNAGTGWIAPFGEVPRNRLERVMALNFLEPFLLLQELLPLMRKAAACRGSATVVAVSSITGINAAPQRSAYSASKAALNSLCRTINVELAPEGVRAVAICPGYVDTDLASWAHDRISPDAMMPPTDVAELVRSVIRLSPQATVPEVMLVRASANISEP
jgi:3-oxoacyl-[acyl-carrier protein] reductase